MMIELRLVRYIGRDSYWDMYMVMKREVRLKEADILQIYRCMYEELV
jgi:hypothetical protein